MTPSKISRRSLLAAVALTIALPATAALGAGKLDTLRSSGAVGERFDGFLVVRDGGGDVQAAVNKINNQRRKIYEKRAQETGVSLEQTGQVYAEQIMKEATAGTFFLKKSGQWVRK